VSAQIVVSPEAEAQIRAIDRWWRENRAAAPEPFTQELSQISATLEAMPFAGHAVPHPEVKDLRRILLRACRCHLYYVAAEETVVVLSVWSAVKGTGPDLRHLGPP
jgi:plasmid stabilization system protein ParE